MSCLLIMAYLCLNDVSSVTVSAPSLMQSASVSIGGAELSLMLKTDGPYALNWQAMDRACKDGLCVPYHKFCSPAGGRVRCTYHLMRPGDRFANRFQLDAPDDAILKAAERNVGILTDSAWRSGVIPLSQFVRQSPHQMPPFCHVRGREQGCWPTTP